MLRFVKRAVAPATRKDAPGVALLEGYELPTWAKESDVLPRLTAISAERLTIVTARARELEEIEARRERIAQMTNERIELLADGKTSGEPDEIVEKAAALLVTIEAERQALSDGERVVETLDRRAHAFDEELAILRTRYTNDVGRLLTGLFAHLAAKYMEEAPALAMRLEQLAAVQDVMMDYRAGNSNGFDRSGYLPRVTPGAGNPGTPLFDCSGGTLRQRTEPIRKQIAADLAAAGYVWRFDA